MDPEEMEKFVAGTDPLHEAAQTIGIAHTNAILWIARRLAAKGIFDRRDIEGLQEAFAKPFDMPGSRNNEIVQHLRGKVDEHFAAIVVDHLAKP